MTVSRPKRCLLCSSRHFTLDLRLTLLSAPSVAKLKHFTGVLVLSRPPGGPASSSSVPQPQPPLLLPLPLTLQQQLPILLLLLLPSTSPLIPPQLEQRFVSELQAR